MYSAAIRLPRNITGDDADVPFIQLHDVVIIAADLVRRDDEAASSYESENGKYIRSSCAECHAPHEVPVPCVPSRAIP